MGLADEECRVRGYPGPGCRPVAGSESEEVQESRGGNECACKDFSVEDVVMPDVKEGLARVEGKGSHRVLDILHELRDDESLSSCKRSTAEEEVGEKSDNKGPQTVPEGDRSVMMEVVTLVRKEEIVGVAHSEASVVDKKEKVSRRINLGMSFLHNAGT